MTTTLTPPEITDATRREFLTLLAAAGLLTGCGSPTPAQPAPAATRQITDSEGCVVDIPVDPQRMLIVNEFMAAPLVTLGYIPYAVSGTTPDVDTVTRLRGFGGTPGDLTGLTVPFTGEQVNVEGSGRSRTSNDQVFQVNSNVWTFPMVQGQIAVLDDIKRLFTGRTIVS